MNFVEGLCKGLNGDIFGIILILGPSELKMINFRPISVKQLAKGYLIARLGLVYYGLYGFFVGFQINGRVGKSGSGLDLLAAFLFSRQFTAHAACCPIFIEMWVLAGTSACKFSVFF